MLVSTEAPQDWAELHWHRDPVSKRYKSAATAGRAAAWLNASEGPHEVWRYRAGPQEADGRVRLERRWVGIARGVIDA